MKHSLRTLNQTIIQCRLCPRLVAYRESVPPRTSFKNEEYWRKPIPGFGDPHAWLLLLGLAPAAHGGNRTGRVFTGDESGRFLFQNLYEAGFANQPNSDHRDDGLELTGCYITAMVKCAPPQNKPLPQECRNCSQYLENELELLDHLKAVIALGKYAFDAFKGQAKQRGANVSGMNFAHGASYNLPGLPTLYGCYHPSPQNTYTGKFTSEMFQELLHTVKQSKHLKNKQQL